MEYLITYPMIKSIVVQRANCRGAAEGECKKQTNLVLCHINLVVNTSPIYFGAYHYKYELKTCKKNYA